MSKKRRAEKTKDKLLEAVRSRAVEHVALVIVTGLLTLMVWLYARANEYITFPARLAAVEDVTLELQSHEEERKETEKAMTEDLKDIKADIQELKEVTKNTDKKIDSLTLKLVK